MLYAIVFYQISMTGFVNVYSAIHRLSYSHFTFFVTHVILWGICLTININFVSDLFMYKGAYVYWSGIYKVHAFFFFFSGGG